MRRWTVLVLTAVLVMGYAWASGGRNQSDFPDPPRAAKQPRTFQEFGQTRVDDYYWLKDKTDPQVIRYLEAENAYTQTVMARTADLQEKLFQEMRGRIKEQDSSVPFRENGYYYYTRTVEGKQYSVYCRKRGSLDAPEEVMFDVNQLAEGQPTFLFANYVVSPDNRIAAWASNNTGSYVEFTIRFRNLETGEDLKDEIQATPDMAWANDSRTLFYVVSNQALRPHRVFRHKLSSNVPDALVFEEPDDRFNVGLERSRTGDYLFIGVESFTSAEVRYLPADRPEGEFRIFQARVPEVQYSVQHHKDRFYIHYKDPESLNWKLLQAPLRGFEDRSTWSEVIPHDPAGKLEYVAVMKNHLATVVRSQAVRQIRIHDLQGRNPRVVSFPEPVYSLSPGGRPEYESTTIRYVYMSLNRPSTTYDYDIASGQSVKLKEQEIPSGFNPDDYTVERLWAVASDGVRVPMAVVYRKGLPRDGSRGALLYGYGSYGANTDAWFNSTVFSLVDRGMVYAIAQVRGGSEMGEQWYEDGKLLNKRNSFTDFVACAEHLVELGFTRPDRLAIMGGSAGGLLVGAAANLRPDLFNTVVALVPFVDVVNTMLDPNLPLTTQEYEQWGDPSKEEYFRYMLSYSPYDNLKRQAYPNILATGGLNDSQVGFHEPAKWVAKLREYKTDDNVLLLKTNMESGHGGASGRFDRLRDVAFHYAFILDRLGIAE